MIHNTPTLEEGIRRSGDLEFKTVSFTRNGKKNSDEQAIFLWKSVTPRGRDVACGLLKVCGVSVYRSVLMTLISFDPQKALTSIAFLCLRMPLFFQLG